MTEQQFEEAFLSELLERSGPPEPLPPVNDLPALDDRQLLQAANQVGTPPLVPPAPDLVALHEYQAVNRPAASSFGREVLEIVRRHPLPTLALAAGLAYLTTRRPRSGRAMGR